MEKINSDELNGKQTRLPLTDDELENVSGGFNLFYVCVQWAMRPGPSPFNEDCRFCFYCVHRNVVGCELGRQ